MPRQYRKSSIEGAHYERLENDVTRTVRKQIETPAEATFFTISALDVATVAQFTTKLSQFETFLKRRYASCEKYLYKRWVYALRGVPAAQLTPTQRARASDFIRLILRQCVVKYLRQWHALAATVYVYRRFMATDESAKERGKLRDIPLSVLLQWARIMRVEFSQLLDSGRLLVEDLLAPLSRGAIETPGTLQRVVYVNAERVLSRQKGDNSRVDCQAPLRVSLACPDMLSDSSYVEQLCTIAQQLPRDDDRRRLSVGQLDLLHRLFILRIMMQTGHESPQYGPLAAAFNLFTYQIDEVIPLRDSLHRLSSFVAHAGRRWHVGGGLLVTPTMLAVWRVRVLMLIDALEHAFYMHRLCRLQICERTESVITADNPADASVTMRTIRAIANAAAAESIATESDEPSSAKPAGRFGVNPFCRRDDEQSRLRLKLHRTIVECSATTINEWCQSHRFALPDVIITPPSSSDAVPLGRI